LDGLRRSTHVYRIQDLQLDDWDLFEELLVALRFTTQLGNPAAPTDNSRKAAEVIRNNLEGQYRLDALSSQDVLRSALQAVAIQRNAE
jgi:hypothetical protein